MPDPTVVATMRVLVTGGAGFIGSSFIHGLLHGPEDAAPCCPGLDRYPRPEASHEVLNVDKLTYAGDPANLDGVADRDTYRLEGVDICDAARIDDLVASFEPDVLVHMAAESHVDRSIESGLPFVRTNVLGTQVLLDAVRRHDVPRMVHVSTDEVYGSIEEGSFTEEDPYDPSSPYSASKAGSDLLALAHRRTYGTPVLITRCTNNYGPRQHPEKLIPKMVTLALDDEPLPVYGDGSNVRDWLYVMDHVEALRLLMTEGAPGEVYNVAGRNERPNLEVVRTLLDLLGKPHDLIEFVEDRPGHDQRYSLDDSKLRGLGWSPRMPFEEGLNLTIRWIGAHRKQMEARTGEDAP